MLSQLLAFTLLGVSESRPASPSVVVVASSGVEAHRSAVGGIQAALGISSSQIRIVDLAEARSGLAAGAGLATPATRVIIAVGSRRCKLWRASSPQFR